MTFIVTTVRTTCLIKKANKLRNKSDIGASHLFQGNWNSPLSVLPDNIMHVLNSAVDEAHAVLDATFK